MSSLITFITENSETANPIKDIFKSDFEYRILQNILRDYQGSEAEVLAEKCKEALENNISCPLVTDVTSVCFNALGGLPGTLISSFVKKLSTEELYKLLEGWEDKSAYIMYSVGLLEEKYGEVQIFQGCLSGTIVQPKKVTTSGWEACFQPDGYAKPYADLPKNVQIDISEQKKALRSLKTYLISKEFFS